MKMMYIFDLNKLDELQLFLSQQCILNFMLFSSNSLLQCLGDSSFDIQLK
jgi:hypothetical protein